MGQFFAGVPIFRTTNALFAKSDDKSAQATAELVLNTTYNMTVAKNLLPESENARRIFLEQAKKKYDNDYKESWEKRLKKGGVCAGMVCVWAGDFLREKRDTGKFPRQMPDDYKETAALLQGIYADATIGAAYLEKFLLAMIPGWEATQTDESAFQLKFESLQQAFAHNQLELVQQSTLKLAAKTDDYRPTVVNLKDELAKAPDTPFIISIDTKKEGSGKHDGYHGIGLCKTDTGYLVMDPNSGLYRYNEERFINEFTNYLITNGLENSPMELSKISDPPSKPGQPPSQQTSSADSSGLG